MSMKEEETLRAYSDRYWELYKEIGGDNRGIVASTFKVGLPIDFDLRASLALKPVTDINKLMERVDEYTKKLRFEIMSSLYKEPVYRIVEKIKNEPYFRWQNKMSGDITRRNQNLFCSNHRDRGHTTEDFQTLKDHLGKLEKAEYLKEFIARDNPQPQDVKRSSTSQTLAPSRGS
ncbi:uncharacterized protein LOC142635487 [Castanea sativa]|uniref:uncharacterized protein LOC142635487 n=1 Tax=Castanea sativa TaxID=21020 RepID=UPI003F64B3E8